MDDDEFKAFWESLLIEASWDEAWWLEDWLKRRLEKWNNEKRGV